MSEVQQLQDSIGEHFFILGVMHEKCGLYSLLLHAVPYCEEPVVNIS